MTVTPPCGGIVVVVVVVAVVVSLSPAPPQPPHRESALDPSLDILIESLCEGGILLSTGEQSALLSSVRK
jgi:hypothetical protein